MKNQQEMMGYSYGSAYSYMPVSTGISGYQGPVGFSGGLGGADASLLLPLGLFSLLLLLSRSRSTTSTSTS